MDRRGFLRALLSGAAGAAAAHTLDLDRLLWVPGERTIFLPPETTVFNVARAGFLKPGDTFVIQGIYAVNPSSRDPGVLQQFVITQHVGHEFSGFVEFAPPAPRRILGELW